MSAAFGMDEGRIPTMSTAATTTAATDTLLAAVPPRDLDTEAAALGAMLLDPTALAVGLRELQEDFTDPQNALLFGALAEAATALGPGQRLDLPIFEAALRKANLLDRVGGRARLIALCEACGSTGNIGAYINILKNATALRGLRDAAAEALRLAAKPDTRPRKIIRLLERAAAKATARAAGESEGAEKSVLTCLANVKALPVKWLWPSRIPLGKVTLLASDPGLGKTLVTLDVAARKSRGTAWPDAPGEPTAPGSVILLSAEDDIPDTIVPRLAVAGADMTRIVALQGVEYRQGGKGYFNLAHDLPALEDAIQRTPDTRLVVIDPISAYLGGTDSHKNAEVRGLLAPLADLAARHGVAILAVTHLNKAGAGRAMYRAMGSLAFVAMARAGWLIVADATDPKRRLMLSLKSNLAEEPDGMAYHVVPVMLDGIGPVARVEWEPGPVNLMADDALAAAAVDPEERTARESAADWLRTILANGPIKTEDLKREAKDAGMAWATVRRAEKPAGARTRKQGFGAEGAWYWFLPDHAPEDAQHPDLSTLA